jgi:peptide/nickel transport system substrate-binding protein
MKKAIKAAAIFILLTSLIIGCGKKEGPKKAKPKKAEPKKVFKPAYGDSIIMGSIGDISGLIPHITSDGSSHTIGSYIYNGLVRYDKNLEIEGELAESWDISDDGLKITFHLRQGVLWHDGELFTADDVMYTYKFMIDPNTPTAYAGDFLMVKSVEVKDIYTIEVTYDEPFAPALISWGTWILPKHLMEGKDLKTTSLATQPIGTGSYKFVEWLAKEKITLEAYDHYFEGRPYIDKVIYRVIPDSATMFLELKSGGIDYMGLEPLQYTKQTDSEEFKKGFNKYKYLSNGYTYLGFNLLHDLFKDKRIRQAVSYAINKEAIIKGVLFGLGQTAIGTYKPGTWVYNQNVKKYAYHPEKAKTLLEEAGWKDTDDDGILDKDGKLFEFTLITNMGNDVRRKVAEIIQAQLKDIGIKVSIRIYEWATFINEFVNKKKFDAVVLGWSLSQDPDIYDIWHSSKTEEGELNFVSFKNKEVDELLIKGRTTFNQEERKKHYDRFQEILAEEAPYAFLYVPEALPAVSSRFQNIEPAPAGITHNFIKWYVPKELQKYK